MNLAAQRDRIRASLGTNQRPWYTIQNASNDRAVIRIYDEISFLGITAETFAADLDKITAKNIEVQINSVGGMVFDGIAIYNALRTHPARITTRVDGLAASIASIIVQAGDRRVMIGGSQMMIHNTWAPCIGNTADMREMADLLERQDHITADIYAQRSHKPVATIRKQMAAETWFTAKEAVTNGLADEVIEPGPNPTGRFDPALTLALLDL